MAEQVPEVTRGLAGAVRVLVVGANEVLVQAMRRALPPEFVVVVVSNLAAAIMDLAADLFDVAVVDVRGHGSRRFHAIHQIKGATPVTEIVALGGHRRGDGEGALEGGAFALLELPFAPESALHAVAKAGEHARLRREVAALRREIGEGHEAAAVLGTSPAAAALRHQVELAARAPLDVLVQGERGAGKEHVARIIHQLGPRRGGPLAVIRCASTPPPMLELEIFGQARSPPGHGGEPGGALGSARGGTLILLDVDQLPYGMQTRLQAALQARGEAGQPQPGPRVIATATRDLGEEARTGRFRRALHARLASFSIRVPPLRERPEDVPLLAGHFAERAARAAHMAVPALGSDAIQALGNRSWPGNVAELEGTIRRAVLASRGPTVTAPDLAALDPAPEPGGDPDPAPASTAADAAGTYRALVDRALAEATRPYLAALMAEFQGNITQAARRAGVERETLHRLLQRFGIDPRTFR